MNLNRLTTKSAEGVQGAVQLAGQLRNPEIMPIHLALVLVQQAGGIVPSILQKLTKDLQPITDKLKAAISSLPTAASTPQPILSSQLRAVFDKAESEAGKLNDEYISTEHLLCGLLDISEIKGLVKLH